MLSSLATLLAIAGLSQVRAQALFNCDGFGFPAVDECDKLMAEEIPWEQGADGDQVVPVENCRTWSYSKCRIEACNFRSDGADQPLNVFTGRAYYAIIKSNCLNEGAGGVSPVGGPLEVRVRNNPEQPPPSRIKRALNGRAESRLITIAESDALAEAEASRQVLDSIDPQSSKRSTIQKRDDPTWIDIGTANNVRKDGSRSRMSAVGSGGTKQSWSTTEGFTSTVGMSMEMGVNLFEIFSASMSVTMEMSHSVEHTETVEFDPTGRCEANQDAVLYYYPLYSKYTGMWSDDQNTAIDVWIPIEGAGNHALDVECLGG